MNDIITPEALQEILDGLEVKLDPAKQETLRKHLQVTLQERIGLALADLLTEQELEQLLGLTQAGDQEKLTAWLEQNVPDYKEVVEDEIDILIGELAESSDKL